MSTTSIKPAEVKKKWFLIDATDLVTGRLAAEVAMILRGKTKATYTPHIDCGDNVIIINAEKVAFKGKKLTNKVYYRHTGHPGGVKETSPSKLIARGQGQRIIKKAVERMLPKDSVLADQQMGNLYVYTGSEHPHTAQNPVTFDFAAKNVKNKKVA